MVNKSTVPVGSATMVEQVIGRPDVGVVSNPEFLREGTAVLDSLNPDRIVVGADDSQAAAKVGELFSSTSAPLIVTDATTSETIKYASNAFLATKLSFVNALAGLCEEVGADARDVLLGLGYDKRIGFEFLRPGPGWGGSCLPKDTRALLHIAREAGYDFSLLAGAIASNDEQLTRVVSKVEHACGGSVDKTTVAVWGLTFKANTDDRRDSPSLQISHRLRELGATVQAFDPTVECRGRGARGPARPAPAGRPLRGGDRRAGAGRADRVGRVPLARPLPGPRRHGGALHRGRPQPARPRRGAADGLLLRGDRTPVNRVVVAGGAGFLGSHLCDRLAGARRRVVCLDDLSTGSKDNVAHLLDHERFTLVVTDVSERVELGDSAPVEAVCNLASPASPPAYLARPFDTLAVGSEGTRRLLELARAHGARFLMASTSEVYGDPEVHPQVESYRGNVDPTGPRSVYDEAKRFAESLTMAMHRTHGVDVGIARIFNTYGPRLSPGDGRVVSNFIVQALRGEPLTVYGDGSQTRSLCFVDDEIGGLLALLDSSLTGPVNIGNPDERSVADLAHFVLEMTGSTSDIVFEPLPTDDPTRRCPDITLAMTELGWKPTTGLREGIQQTIDYFAEKVQGP